ncbi:MAG TPA: hypothetical protein VFO05_13900, partial [Candidatus Limnocylindrales bacterium]|nr:hypothetical protein [Candidatus Limnocylindrales bacterium]
MDSTAPAPAAAPEWERRFSLWSATSLEVAASGGGRAAIVASAGALRQLHAWDRATGDLRRLTDAPHGVTMAAISADGRLIFFVDDPAGSELGWLARVPFDGGPPERFDAGLPAAEIWGIATGPGGVAWTRIEDDRFVHRVLPADGPASRPSRILATDDAMGHVAAWSRDGSTLVIARYREDFRREVVLRDVATGDVVAEARSPDGSIILNWQSSLPGDDRYLGHMDVDGRRRPIAWDATTGAIERLPDGDLAGDLRAIALSPGGRRLALLQGHEAIAGLHLLDLVTGRLDRLGAPSGALGATFSLATG